MGLGRRIAMGDSFDDMRPRSVAALRPASTREGAVMRVQDIIRTKGDDVIMVLESMVVEQAAGVMHQRAVGALVVVAASGQVKGVISEREIVVALAHQGKAALELLVRDVMLPHH